MKQANIMLCILILMIVVLMTGCSSPTKTVKKFEKAITEEDAAALMKLVGKEENVYWTVKEAKEVIDYFAENESQLTMLVEQLNDQVVTLKAKETIKDAGGLFYFTDDKQFTVRSFEVNIDQSSFSPFKKLTATITGMEPIMVENGGNQAVLVGLVGPGSYAIKGLADYGYMELEGETEFNLLGDAASPFFVELALSGSQFEVYSQVENTNVLLNEQDVNQGVGEEATKLGPIVAGITIQGEAEYDWGKLYSESISYVEGDAAIQSFDITPNVFINEADQAEIAAVITEYYRLLFEGLIKSDRSILQGVSSTEEVKNAFSAQFDVLDTLQAGGTPIQVHHMLGPEFYTGYYQGDITETISDFAQVSSVHDKELATDVLSVQSYIYSDFMFVYTELPEAPTSMEATYLDPTVGLIKQDGNWIIVEQDVDFMRHVDAYLPGDWLVKTQVAENSKKKSKE